MWRMTNIQTAEYLTRKPIGFLQNSLMTSLAVRQQKQCLRSQPDGIHYLGEVGRKINLFLELDDLDPFIGEPSEDAQGITHHHSLDFLRRGRLYTHPEDWFHQFRKDELLVVWLQLGLR
eukprot:TRINITY_DN110163_c0_g1_i1.p2 TRINITY_DN110163_c0_g1~~TRINITY_DN110163_c0_g1_i1.p2  ORF type:complete len:119 (+),score=11.96 TRINITY_DN110163_c0_g1_i1:516-872(+)